MNLELRHITKRYDEATGPILDDISLTVPEGSALAVIGPSGSGKSTLLNLLGTLDFPTSGTVLLDGVSTTALSTGDLSGMRNRRIGFVFQTHLLLPQLTVFENILLPTVPLNEAHQKQAQERARQLLQIVGLGDKEKRYPGEMSVGECQRVAVVRALINEPELLLTDEPTGSLDHDTADRLGDMILELKKRQSFTLITVTHSADLARKMASSYTLVNGKINKIEK
jgi:lipoprotein-releasing system ATP-binding protein